MNLWVQQASGAYVNFVQPFILQHEPDLASATAIPVTLQYRVRRPLAPINLRVNGDGRTPTYGAGAGVSVNWDRIDPRRTVQGPTAVLVPAIGRIVVELLTLGGVLKETFAFSAAGPLTMTNAQIVAALGAETDFVLRAWFDSGGRRSLESAELLRERLDPMATIPPGRLNDVTNAADHIILVADNFDVLSEELFKVTPTYQNGAPNTVIGPPNSGERVLGELWKDSLGGWWKCTAAGTPGTWQQVLPAAVVADPASGTVPTGYLYHGEDYAASHYETQVQNHFGRLREHPVVALATRLKEDRNVDYGVQLSLAVHVDDAVNLQLRVPLDPWPETLHERWTPELIDEFLACATSVCAHLP